MHRHVGERCCWSLRKSAADAQDRTVAVPSRMIARPIHVRVIVVRVIVRGEREGKRAKKGEDEGGRRGSKLGGVWSR